MKGEAGNCLWRRRVRDERGQVVVFFALLLPLLFVLAAIDHLCNLDETGACIAELVE